MTSLRVMTYNVRQLRDDRAAVVTVLRECTPDVVALQEPPRGPFGRARLAALARDAGLVPVVSGGGARTTALLARPGLELTGARGMRQPWRVGRTRRGLAYADLGGLRIVSVHLALAADERAGQVLRLLPVLASVPDCLVLGDLNEQPGGASWRRLGQHLHDLAPGAGPTYPARAPRRRIDAVLGSRGVTATGARAPDGEAVARASDHRPVVVDVRWA